MKPKTDEELKQKCYDGDDPRIKVTKEFVERNKLSININVAQNILQASDDDFDFFGFETEIAIDFLPWKQAKQFCKGEFVKKVESGIEKYRQITDVYEAAQDFLDYMVFAWMKARDKKGLSGGRSICKLSAWMKILGREDVSNVLKDDSLYDSYGKPALRKACEMLCIKCPDDIK